MVELREPVQKGESLALLQHRQDPVLLQLHLSHLQCSNNIRVVTHIPLLCCNFHYMIHLMEVMILINEVDFMTLPPAPLLEQPAVARLSEMA
jgi:hypothetical protein